MGENERHCTKAGPDGKPHHFTYWDESVGTTSAGPARPSNARWYYPVDDQESPADAGEVSPTQISLEHATVTRIERRLWDHYAAGNLTTAVKNTIGNVR